MNSGVPGNPRPLSCQHGSVLTTFFLAALVGFGLLGCTAEDPERPPNLVLISLDNLGARHVGAYGAGRQTTPFLDGLARRGVLFENAQAQATWTLPSHASMLSSRLVGGHGVWTVERRFPEGPALLPEVLRDAGWDTAAFTSCDFVSELFGLGRGFDHMVTKPEPAEQITNRLLEFLPRVEDGPFLLFLHFYDVHQPFNEPNPYGEDFSEGMAEDELDAAWQIVALKGRYISELTEDEISWLSEIFPQHNVREYLEEGRRDGAVIDDWIMRFVYQYLAQEGAHSLEARKARYDNGVANMDKRLAELFEELERFPWFEDTVFVITSDHGESFNEPPGVLGHGCPPYREQTHVPLIVFGRGIPPGVRIASPVASIDIAPTLLELAGVASPEEFQGLSLVPAFHGEDVLERPLISGELRAGSVGVRSGDWNLLVDQRGVKERLFDLSETSRRDLSDSRPEIVERLQKWLHLEQERNAELAAEIKPSNVQIDEEVRKRLQELGYLR